MNKAILISIIGLFILVLLTTVIAENNLLTGMASTPQLQLTKLVACERKRPIGVQGLNREWLTDWFEMANNNDACLPEKTKDGIHPDSPKYGGVISYILNNQEPGTKLLKLCMRDWSSTNSVYHDYFATTDPNCEGGEFERDLGYIYENQQPLTVPLYSCRWGGSPSIHAGGYTRTNCGAGTTQATFGFAYQNPPQPLDSKCKFDINAPNTLYPGQLFDVFATMDNIGTETWNEDHYTMKTTLRHFGERKVTQHIPPGEWIGLKIEDMQAPFVEGSYELQVQMQKDGDAFGEICKKTINVIDNPNIADCSKISFSEVLNPGESLISKVTFKNIGTKAWDTQNYAVSGFIDGSNIVSSDIPKTTNPNEEVTVNLGMVALSTSGTYNYEWKIYEVQGTGEPIEFGACQKTVQVSPSERLTISVGEKVPVGDFQLLLKSMIPLKLEFFSETDKSLIKEITLTQQTLSRAILGVSTTTEPSLEMEITKAIHSLSNNSLLLKNVFNQLLNIDTEYARQQSITLFSAYHESLFNEDEKGVVETAEFLKQRAGVGDNKFIAFFEMNVNTDIDIFADNNVARLNLYMVNVLNRVLDLKRDFNLSENFKLLLEQKQYRLQNKAQINEQERQHLNTLTSLLTKLGVIEELPENVLSCDYQDGLNIQKTPGSYSFYAKDSCLGQETVQQYQCKANRDGTFRVIAPQKKCPSNTRCYELFEKTDCHEQETVSSLLEFFGPERVKNMQVAEGTGKFVGIESNLNIETQKVGMLVSDKSIDTNELSLNLLVNNQEQPIILDKIGTALFGGFFEVPEKRLSDLTITLKYNELSSETIVPLNVILTSVCEQTSNGIKLTTESERMKISGGPEKEVLLNEEYVNDVYCTSSKNLYSKTHTCASNDVLGLSSFEDVRKILEQHIETEKTDACEFTCSIDACTKEKTRLEFVAEQNGNQYPYWKYFRFNKEGGNEIWANEELPLRMIGNAEEVKKVKLDSDEPDWGITVVKSISFLLDEGYKIYFEELDTYRHTSKKPQITIISEPPKEVVEGEEFTYQIEVLDRNKFGSLYITVEGLDNYNRIFEDGEKGFISWSSPVGSGGETKHVKIKVFEADTTQQVYGVQDFDLKINKREATINFEFGDAKITSDGDTKVCENLTCVFIIPKGTMYLINVFHSAFSYKFDYKTNYVPDYKLFLVLTHITNEVGEIVQDFRFAKPEQFFYAIGDPDVKKATLLGEPTTVLGLIRKKEHIDAVIGYRNSGLFVGEPVVLGAYTPFIINKVGDTVSMDRIFTKIGKYNLHYKIIGVNKDSGGIFEELKYDYQNLKPADEFSFLKSVENAEFEEDRILSVVFKENNPPEFTGETKSLDYYNTGKEVILTGGEELVYDIEFKDEDGDELSFALENPFMDSNFLKNYILPQNQNYPEGITIEEAKIMKWTAPEVERATDYWVKIVADDGRKIYNSVSRKLVKILVKPAEKNKPPIFKTPTELIVYEDQENDAGFYIQATDEDDNSFAYRIVEASPEAIEKLELNLESVEYTGGGISITLKKENIRGDAGKELKFKVEVDDRRGADNSKTVQEFIIKIVKKQARIDLGQLSISGYDEKTRCNKNTCVVERTESDLTTPFPILKFKYEIVDYEANYDLSGDTYTVLESITDKDGNILYSFNKIEPYQDGESYFEVVGDPKAQGRIVGNSMILSEDNAVYFHSRGEVSDLNILPIFKESGEYIFNYRLISPTESDGVEVASYNYPQNYKGKREYLRKVETPLIDKKTSVLVDYRIIKQYKQERVTLNAVSGELFSHKVDIETDTKTTLIFKLKEVTGTKLPAGMTIDEKEGMITWTPMDERVTKYAFNVEVTGTGFYGFTYTAAVIYFDITVDVKNEPPKIISTPEITSVKEGDTFEYLIEVQDENDKKHDYKITEPIHAGYMGFTIKETPEGKMKLVWPGDKTGGNVGTHNIKIEVDDLRGTANSKTVQEFQLTITEGPSFILNGKEFDKIDLVSESRGITTYSTPEQEIVVEVSFENNYLLADFSKGKFRGEAIFNSLELPFAKGKDYIFENGINFRFDELTNNLALKGLPEDVKIKLYVRKAEVAEKEGKVLKVEKDAKIGNPVNVFVYDPSKGKESWVKAQLKIEDDTGIIEEKEIALISRILSGEFDSNTIVYSGKRITPVKITVTYEDLTVTTELLPYLTQNIEIFTDKIKPAKQELEYKQQILAYALEEGAITYEVDGPEWLTINSDTGLLSGTPGEQDLGETIIIIKARDKLGNTAEKQFNLKIAGPQSAPKIISIPPTTARFDEVYVYNIKTEDFDLDYGDQLTLRIITKNNAPDNFKDLIPEYAVYPKEAVLTDNNNGTAKLTWVPDQEQPGVFVSAIIVRDRTESVHVQYLKFTKTDTGYDIKSFGELEQLQEEIKEIITPTPPKIISTPPEKATFEEMYKYEIKTDDPNLALNDKVSLRMIRKGNAPEEIKEKIPEDVIYPESAIFTDKGDGTAVLNWVPSQKFRSPFVSAIMVRDLAGGTHVQYLMFTKTSSGYEIKSFGELEQLAEEELPTPIDIPFINQAPRIDSKPETHVFFRELYNYMVFVQDPEKSKDFKVTLEKAPEGMRIVQERDERYSSISWVPQEAGSYEVVIKATDPEGASSEQAFTIIVEKYDNYPPNIISEHKKIAIEGKEYRYQLQVEDLDNDIVSYELVDAPEGMNVNENKLITWTPTSEQAIKPNNIHTFFVQLDDGRGYPNSKVKHPLSITVKKPVKMTWSLNEVFTPKEGNWALKALCENNSCNIRDTVSAIWPTIVFSYGTDYQKTDELTVTDMPNYDIYLVLESVKDTNGNIVKDFTKAELRYTYTEYIPTTHEETVVLEGNENVVGLLTSSTDSIYQHVRQQNLYNKEALRLWLKENNHIKGLLPAQTDGQTLVYNFKVIGVNLDDSISEVKLVQNKDLKERGRRYLESVENKDFEGELSITVNFKANKNPIITTEQIESKAFKDKLYSQKIEAEDVNEDVLAFSLENAPEGMNVDSSGQITWTPAQEDVGKTYELIVKVNDGIATVQKTFTVNVFEKETKIQIASRSLIGEGVTSCTDLTCEIIEATQGLQSIDYNIVSDYQEKDYLPKYRLVSILESITDETGNIIKEFNKDALGLKVGEARDLEEKTKERKTAFETRITVDAGLNQLIPRIFGGESATYNLRIVGINTEKPDALLELKDVFYLAKLENPDFEEKFSLTIKNTAPKVKLSLEVNEVMPFLSGSINGEYWDRKALYDSETDSYQVELQKGTTEAYLSGIDLVKEGDFLERAEYKTEVYLVKNGEKELMLEYRIPDPVISQIINDLGSYPVSGLKIDFTRLPIAEKKDYEFEVRLIREGKIIHVLPLKVQFTEKQLGFNAVVEEEKFLADGVECTLCSSIPTTYEAKIKNIGLKPPVYGNVDVLLKRITDQDGNVVKEFDNEGLHVGQEYAYNVFTGAEDKITIPLNIGKYPKAFNEYEDIPVPQKGSGKTYNYEFVVTAFAYLTLDSGTRIVKEIKPFQKFEARPNEKIDYHEDYKFVISNPKISVVSTPVSVGEYELIMQEIRGVDEKAFIAENDVKDITLTIAVSEKDQKAISEWFTKEPSNIIKITAGSYSKELSGAELKVLQVLPKEFGYNKDFAWIAVFKIPIKGEDVKSNELIVELISTSDKDALNNKATKVFTYQIVLPKTSEMVWNKYDPALDKVVAVYDEWNTQKLGETTASTFITEIDRFELVNTELKDRTVIFYFNTNVKLAPATVKDKSRDTVVNIPGLDQKYNIPEEYYDKIKFVINVEQEKAVKTLSVGGSDQIVELTADIDLIEITNDMGTNVVTFKSSIKTGDQKNQKQFELEYPVLPKELQLLSYETALDLTSTQPPKPTINKIEDVTCDEVASGEYKCSDEGMMIKDSKLKIDFKVKNEGGLYSGPVDLLSLIPSTDKVTTQVIWLGGEEKTFTVEIPSSKLSLPEAGKETRGLIRIFIVDDLSKGEREEEYLFSDVETFSLQLKSATLPPPPEKKNVLTINEGENALINLFEGKTTDKYYLLYDKKDTPVSTSNYDDFRGPETTGSVTPLYTNAGVYLVQVLKVTSEGESIEEYTVTVNNIPPTANAGRDITVKVGETVQFNGGGSYAGDYDEIKFNWDFNDKDRVNFEDSTEPAPTYMYELPGIYTATLRVYDDDNTYADDTVLVTVKPVELKGTIGTVSVSTLTKTTEESTTTYRTPNNELVIQVTKQGNDFVFDINAIDDGLLEVLVLEQVLPLDLIVEPPGIMYYDEIKNAFMFNKDYIINKGITQFTVKTVEAVASIGSNGEFLKIQKDPPGDNVPIEIFDKAADTDGLPGTDSITFTVQTSQETKDVVASEDPNFAGLFRAYLTLEQANAITGGFFWKITGFFARITGFETINIGSDKQITVIYRTKAGEELKLTQGIVVIIVPPEEEKPAIVQPVSGTIGTQQLSTLTAETVDDTTTYKTNNDELVVEVVQNVNQFTLNFNAKDEGILNTLVLEQPKPLDIIVEPPSIVYFNDATNSFELSKDYAVNSGLTSVEVKTLQAVVVTSDKGEIVKVQKDVSGNHVPVLIQDEGADTDDKPGTDSVTVTIETEKGEFEITAQEDQYFPGVFRAYIDFSTNSQITGGFFWRITGFFTRITGRTITLGSSGTFTIKYTSSSGQQLELTNTAQLPAPVNAQPQIVSEPAVAAKEDEEYIYQVTATDQDNDVLLYSLVNAPEGMQIDSSGRISWTPGKDVLKTDVTVKVDDQKGKDNSVVTQKFTISVEPLPEQKDLEVTNIEVTPAGVEFTEKTPVNIKILLKDLFNNVVNDWRLSRAPVKIKLSLDGIVIEELDVNHVRNEKDNAYYARTVFQNVELLTAGTHTFKVELTSTDLVGDANTQNNIVEKSIEIKKIELPPPTPEKFDLKVEEVKIKVNEKECQYGKCVVEEKESKFKVAFTLKNTGLGMYSSEPKYYASVVLKDARKGFSRLITDPILLKSKQDVLQVLAPQERAVLEVSINDFLTTYNVKPKNKETYKYVLDVVVHPEEYNVIRGIGTIVGDKNFGDNTASITVEITNEYKEPVCGDNIIDEGEVCDGTELSGQTCENRGFFGGEIKCESTCKLYDVSKCLEEAPKPVNKAPVIESKPVEKVVEGEEYIYEVIAADQDNDELSYSLTKSPQGMQINNGGRISWTPEKDLTKHEEIKVEVAVKVDDRKEGIVEQAFTLTITQLLPEELVIPAPIEGASLGNIDLLFYRDPQTYVAYVSVKNLLDKDLSIKIKYKITKTINEEVVKEETVDMKGSLLAKESRLINFIQHNNRVGLEHGFNYKFDLELQDKKTSEVLASTSQEFLLKDTQGPSSELLTPVERRSEELSQEVGNVELTFLWDPYMYEAYVPIKNTLTTKNSDFLIRYRILNKDTGEVLRDRTLNFEKPLNAGETRMFHFLDNRISLIDSKTTRFEIELISRDNKIIGKTNQDFEIKVISGDTPSDTPLTPINKPVHPTQLEIQPIQYTTFQGPKTFVASVPVKNTQDKSTSFFLHYKVKDPQTGEVLKERTWYQEDPMLAGETKLLGFMESKQDRLGLEQPKVLTEITITNMKGELIAQSLQETDMQTLKSTIKETTRMPSVSVCGNKIKEEGEACEASEDCPVLPGSLRSCNAVCECAYKTLCGNNVCDTAEGETEELCPEDCKIAVPEPVKDISLGNIDLLFYRPPQTYVAYVPVKNSLDKYLSVKIKYKITKTINEEIVKEETVDVKGLLPAKESRLVNFIQHNNRIGLEHGFNYRFDIELLDKKTSDVLASASQEFLLKDTRGPSSELLTPVERRSEELTQELGNVELTFLWDPYMYEAYIPIKNTLTKNLDFLLHYRILNKDTGEVLRDRTLNFDKLLNAGETRMFPFLNNRISLIDSKVTRFEIELISRDNKIIGKTSQDFEIRAIGGDNPSDIPLTAINKPVHPTQLEIQPIQYTIFQGPKTFVASVPVKNTLSESINFFVHYKIKDAQTGELLKEKNWYSDKPILPGETKLVGYMGAKQERIGIEQPKVLTEITFTNMKGELIAQTLQETDMQTLISTIKEQQRIEKLEVQVCGNNIREGTEVCDENDLGGQTCETALPGISTGGILNCELNCKGFIVDNCSLTGMNSVTGGFWSDVLYGMWSWFK